MKTKNIAQRKEQLIRYAGGRIGDRAVAAILWKGVA